MGSSNLLLGSVVWILHWAVEFGFLIGIFGWGSSLVPFRVDLSELGMNRLFPKQSFSYEGVLTSSVKEPHLRLSEMPVLKRSLE